jgi:hypothetical protein
MLTSEFKLVLDDVFEEYLPKISAKRRAEFAEALAAELRDRGLDVEPDGDDLLVATGGNLFDDPEAY